MIITELDKVISAEEAKKISLNNKDESIDRSDYRSIMEGIRWYASFGKTSYTVEYRTKQISETVENILRENGFTTERWSKEFDPGIEYFYFRVNWE